EDVLVLALEQRQARARNLDANREWTEPELVAGLELHFGRHAAVDRERLGRQRARRELHVVENDFRRTARNRRIVEEKIAGGVASDGEPLLLQDRAAQQELGREHVGGLVLLEERARRVALENELGDRIDADADEVAVDEDPLAAHPL